MTKKRISVIIPAYNEEESIGLCLQSLKNQTYPEIEIIIVDDGSTDLTLKIAKKFNVKVFTQKHKGPGVARNLGAKKASGEILVFIDADMTFDKNFILDLTKPVLEGKTIGTFSKNEMNANKEIVWSRAWNINRGWPPGRLIPQTYPDTSPVFRSILKSKFEKAGGFDTTGEYTDDWSLSGKLGVKSEVSSGAIYFHKNPANLKEIWQQARWIGKNYFISGNVPRRIRSLIFYSLPISVLIGLYKTIIKFNLDPRFILFKIVYDFAVWTSVLRAFFKEAKYK